MPDKTKPRPRRQLHEHITEALLASVSRILTEYPDPALRDELAEWMETAHERVEVEALVDRGKTGRIDTRSLRMDCYVVTSVGRAPLCSVRARDLITSDGTPVDAKTDARTLLLQLGIGIPDTLEGIDTNTE